MVETETMVADGIMVEDETLAEAQGRAPAEIAQGVGEEEEAISALPVGTR